MRRDWIDFNSHPPLSHLVLDSSRECREWLESVISNIQVKTNVLSITDHLRETSLYSLSTGLMQNSSIGPAVMHAG
jgi:hypothetical protein